MLWNPPKRRPDAEGRTNPQTDGLLAFAGGRLRIVGQEPDALPVRPLLQPQARSAAELPRYQGAARRGESDQGPLRLHRQRRGPRAYWRGTAPGGPWRAAPACPTTCASSAPSASASRASMGNWATRSAAWCWRCRPRRCRWRSGCGSSMVAPPNPRRATRPSPPEKLTGLAGWAPPTLLVLAGRVMSNPQGGANINVTNVPGPQFPLYSGGAQLLEVWPFAPLYPSMGLGIAIVSYNGNLYLGFSADTTPCPRCRGLHGPDPGRCSGLRHTPLLGTPRAG